MSAIQYIQSNNQPNQANEKRSITITIDEKTIKIARIALAVIGTLAIGVALTGAMIGIPSLLAMAATGQTFTQVFIEFVSSGCILIACMGGMMATAMASYGLWNNILYGYEVESDLKKMQERALYQSYDSLVKEHGLKNIEKYRIVSPAILEEKRQYQEKLKEIDQRPSAPSYLLEIASEFERKYEQREYNKSLSSEKNQLRKEHEQTIINILRAERNRS